MEIYRLVDKMVEDIRQGTFYSELTGEQLKDILFEHFNDEYNKMISELSVYFEIKKMSGYKVSDKDYELEFGKIKLKLLKMMEEVSRSH